MLWHTSLPLARDLFLPHHPYMGLVYFQPASRRLQLLAAKQYRYIDLLLYGLQVEFVFRTQCWYRLLFSTARPYRAKNITIPFHIPGPFLFCVGCVSYTATTNFSSASAATILLYYYAELFFFSKVSDPSVTLSSFLLPSKWKNGYVFSWDSPAPALALFLSHFQNYILPREVSWHFEKETGMSIQPPCTRKCIY